MTARKFSSRNISWSRFTASLGRGSSEGCRKIGIRAAMDVKRGINALRRRYISFDDESNAFAARLYKAALTPLKLTVRDIARGRLVGKFLMQRIKHTVLNQQMLQPASKHSKNTWNKLQGE